MDAAKAFLVHLLDMGRESYGDCVLVEVGGKRILVDGGHPGDAFDNARIAKQLGTLLKGSQPHAIDLLVVTHCHGDHIGCLEDLIANGVVSVENALVADPDLGFPAKKETDEPALSRDGERILHALEEEAFTTLPDTEIARVLDGVAIYREDYERLLTALAGAGAEVVFYGRDGLGPSEAAGDRPMGPFQLRQALPSRQLQRLRRRRAGSLAGDGEPRDLHRRGEDVASQQCRPRGLESTRGRPPLDAHGPQRSDHRLAARGRSCEREEATRSFQRRPAQCGV